MNTIDVKIEKICKELEKNFNAQIARGKVYKIKDKITIPISIKKVDSQDQHSSAYNLPIGLIRIDGNRVEFVSIEQKRILIKTIIKIFLIFLGILGIRNLFKARKKWNTDI